MGPKPCDYNDPRAWVYHLRDSDVVCARNPGVNGHPGNRLFRKKISMQVGKFQLTKGDKRRRMALIIETMNDLESCRFLRPVRDGSNGKISHYVQIPSALVRHKIGNSLRFHERAMLKQKAKAKRVAAPSFNSRRAIEHPAITPPPPCATPKNTGGQPCAEAQPGVAAAPNRGAPPQYSRPSVAQQPYSDAAGGSGFPMTQQPVMKGQQYAHRGAQQPNSFSRPPAAPSKDSCLLKAFTEPQRYQAAKAAVNTAREAVVAAHTANQAPANLGPSTHERGAAPTDRSPAVFATSDAPSPVENNADQSSLQNRRTGERQEELLRVASARSEQPVVPEALISSSNDAAANHISSDCITSRGDGESESESDNSEEDEAIWSDDGSADAAEEARACAVVSCRDAHDDETEHEGPDSCNMVETADTLTEPASDLGATRADSSPSQDHTTPDLPPLDSQQEEHDRVPLLVAANATATPGHVSIQLDPLTLSSWANSANHPNAGGMVALWVPHEIVRQAHQYSVMHQQQQLQLMRLKAAAAKSAGIEPTMQTAAAAAARAETI